MGLIIIKALLLLFSAWFAIGSSLMVHEKRKAFHEGKTDYYGRCIRGNVDDE